MPPCIRIQVIKIIYNTIRSFSIESDNILPVQKPSAPLKQSVLKKNNFLNWI